MIAFIKSLFKNEIKRFCYVDIFDVNNKRIGQMKFDQDYIDICPINGRPTMVHRAIVNGQVNHFCIIQD